jgi:hypothetical protein
VLDPLPRAILTWRRIRVVPVVLRAVVAAGSLVAIAGTTLPSFDVPDGYIAAAVVAAAVWAVAPDSAAGLVFVGLLAMAWLTGGTGDIDPATLITALALLGAHVAAALAAAMPVTARADRTLLVRWATPMAGCAAAVLAATALLAALDAWSPPGSLVVTLGALTLLSATVWWWSVPPDRADPGVGAAESPR